MVAYAYIPKTPDAEAGESETLCHPGLQSKIPFQKNIKQNNLPINFF